MAMLNNKMVIYVDISLHNRISSPIAIYYVYLYTVRTFEYVEGGPDREAPEVVWIGFRMLAGRAKANLPGGSLKYMFV